MILVGASAYKTLQAETYRLVTAPFKPFTDPDHPKGGFLTEVTRQALAIRGHDIEVHFKPWARALTQAANAEYDGLLSAFYNTERSRLFYFSAPLNTTRMVFVGLSDSLTISQYSNLSELEHLAVGVGRKWAYSEEFEANTRFEKHVVNNEPAGIRMLFSGRIDLFAVNEDQFYYAINEDARYNLRDTQVLLPPISLNNQHIAAALSAPKSLKFLAEFNTGLAAIKANGTYREIRKEFFGF